jgi:hypothetical protein
LVQDTVFEPASLMIHPIYTNNDTTLVGISSAVHNWNSVLSNNLPDFISGIQCSLVSGNKTYNYLYTNGGANYNTIILKKENIIISPLMIPV